MKKSKTKFEIWSERHKREFFTESSREAFYEAFVAHYPDYDTNGYAYAPEMNRLWYKLSGGLHEHGQDTVKIRSMANAFKKEKYLDPARLEEWKNNVLTMAETRPGKTLWELKTISESAYSDGTQIQKEACVLIEEILVRTTQTDPKLAKDQFAWMLDGHVRNGRALKAVRNAQRTIEKWATSNSSAIYTAEI